MLEIMIQKMHQNSVKSCPQRVPRGPQRWSQEGPREEEKVIKIASWSPGGSREPKMTSPGGSREPNMTKNSTKIELKINKKMYRK